MASANDSHTEVSEILQCEVSFPTCLSQKLACRWLLQSLTASAHFILPCSNVRSVRTFQCSGAQVCTTLFSSVFGITKYNKW